jgi:hypothetical protein
MTEVAPSISAAVPAGRDFEPQKGPTGYGLPSLEMFQHPSHVHLGPVILSRLLGDMVLTAAEFPLLRIRQPYQSRNTVRNPDV